MNTTNTLTGRMKRICGWCKLVLGEKECAPEQDGTETHGICPDCAATLAYPELADRIATADKAELARITLAELPQIADEEYRLALRCQASRRAELLAPK
jgi:hypothetical protein